jgi:hypothetical protein
MVEELGGKGVKTLGRLRERSRGFGIVYLVSKGSRSPKVKLMTRNRADKANPDGLDTTSLTDDGGERTLGKGGWLFAGAKHKRMKL